MSRAPEQNYKNANANETGTRFVAPRPAVTTRLGKKRTDELIQADGDTWQEWLAVSEKTHKATSNGSKSSGGALSFFGKKNKKKQSANSSSNAANANVNVNGNGNGNGSNNLTIRSYFQNRRTGKKVWDEPPSGASNIVPASEEMRRMAELQLGELYVATTPSADIEDLDKSKDSANSNNDKKKKSLGGGIFGWGNKPSGSNGGKMGEHASTTESTSSSGKRIRYKRDSNLNTSGNASAAGRVSNGRKSLNDLHLQEAINRSMAESINGVSKASGTIETEEEVLRRVLEESRLEALPVGKARANNYYNKGYDDDDYRKPTARKHPPTKRRDP